MKVSISYSGAVGWASDDSSTLLLIGFGFVSQSKGEVIPFHKGDKISCNLVQWSPKDDRNKKIFYAKEVQRG